MLKLLAYCNYQSYFILLFPKINFFRITVIFLLFFSSNSFAQQLPSCQTLPQFLAGKANPGSNCLADCNAMPAGITANNGTNCLFDCDNMPSGTNPIHGNNCAFKINGYVMPLCNTVPDITSPLDSNYVLRTGITKKPRENCADLIDLPLCNLFTSNANNKKNCVKLCTELSPASLQDRIYNRDCIRFCSNPESDATSATCSALKCYHYINTATAPPTNPACETTACTNLTVNELNKANLYSSAVSNYKYCIPTNKCFNFNTNQLDAIKAGYDLATGDKAPPLYRFCQLHTCRTLADSSCAPHATDEIAMISESSSYSTKYVNSIISSTSSSISTLTGLCVNKVCSGVIQARYPCTGPSYNVPDPECPAGTSCSNSVCSFIIDCDSLSTSAEQKNKYCNPLIPPQSSAPLDTSNSYTQLIGKTWFYLPKPMNKSYQNDNPSDGYRIMTYGDLCYTPQQLNQSGFGNHLSAFDGGCSFIGRSNFAFDHNYLTMDTRSPNVCESRDGKFGNRGTSGWIDVCGSRSFTTLPDITNLGYIDNISSIWSNNTSSHRVRVCLRYDNGMIPDRTCGARECGITCSCGICSSVCGSDVCRELIVKENDPRECQDPTNSDKGCAVTYGYGSDLDNYLRARAVGFQADNRVCVMFDWKGGLAYNPIFMNGSESLPEDTTKCLSGTYSPSTKTCINGKNSNDDAGSASTWRAVSLVKYIDQNVTVGGVKGIKDVFGNFFPEANCVRRQLRVSPPNLYNLANYENSPNLFSPPLIINKAKIKIGGAVSNPTNPSELLGSTDFNEPEVEILYGTTTINLSLGIGKNGNETGSDIDPNSKQVIGTAVFGKNFTATVYAKKLYDVLNGPKFCVFRELRDRNNALIDPAPMVGCVKRKFPEIDNCDLRDGNCVASPDRNIYRKKFLLEKDISAGNDLYNKIIVKYRYLVNYGKSISDISCNPTNKCSPYGSVEFNLSTRNQMQYCVAIIDSIDFYPLCFARDDCTVLNMECMANETVISNAPDTLSDRVLNIRENCQKKLELCNNKKNIVTTSKTFDPNKFNADPLNNYYGWFNEVCLYEGFNHKSRQVYAYKISGFDGKCIVMPPYNDNAECANGGKMPNCPCTIYDPNVPTPSHVSSINALTRTTRTETLHEAGLCLDITLPKTCPAIDYLEGYTPTTNDPFYIVNSLNLLSSSGYNDTTGVHSTHRLRTNGGLGYAEYNASIAGNIARGVCNGFWKHKIMYGQRVFPELNCKADGTWNTTLENVASSCERHSCPEIQIPSLNNSTGIYSNNYGSHEISEAKGTTDGFAYWPKTNLTTDYALYASASDCITGFRKVGSTTNFSYPSSVTIPSTKKTLANASIFGSITSYSSGTAPSRICNQIGEWQSVNNSCLRISCPAVNPGTTAPSEEDDFEVWKATWKRFGGARFASINASRSSSEVITYSGIGSRQAGTCEAGLGFYQPAGSASPTMDCDHLGNWTNLQNACQNDCGAITRAATNEANGFAKWNTVTFSNTDPDEKQSTGECVDDSNYFNYPYPPRRKNDGTLYTLTSGTPDYITTIPETVSSDTRSPQAPVRKCTLSTFGGTTASRWSVPSSTCVSTLTASDKPNGCVSGDPNDAPSLMYDERINAGITRHTILDSTNTQITISIPWQRRRFGETQVRYCDSNNNFCQNFNASTSSHNSNTYYHASRTKSFVIARYCNTSTKKWDPPVAYCVATGNLGNSLNSSVTASASSLDGSYHYLLGAGGTAAISCNAGYASTSTPYIRCDSSVNLNQYRLVKNDSNNCVKYCDTNSDGSFPGSSYSYLRGPGSTRFYSGNTTTGTCSGYPCGSQTVTATCTDSGWSIPAPECRACNPCTSSSPTNLDSLNGSGSTESSRIYSKTVSNYCTVERFDPLCLLKNASSVPSTSHGLSVGVYKQKETNDCWGKVWEDGRVCGAAKFTCNDGTWYYTQDYSHGWVCDRTSNYSYGSSADCTVGHHNEQRTATVECVGSDNTGVTNANDVCGK